MRNTATDWTWPQQASAAISLSYDDGNYNNLECAIPDLNARALRGTFYLPTGWQNVRDRKAEWKQVFMQGHEIGNHSVCHPCRADLFTPNIPDWLQPEMQLEHYSPHDIRREVDEAANWLHTEIGEDVLRTYAYPCASVAIGIVPDESSYDAAILRHYFAARIGGQRANDPRTVNLLRIYSFGFANPSLLDLIGYCREALDTQGWTVLMFHGVGGPSHMTERLIHQQLLDYLLEQSCWVAPVRDVASYIVKNRAAIMSACRGE